LLLDRRMSARSAAPRPLIPRPANRSSEPPSAFQPPPSSRPILAAKAAYAVEPPVIRERFHTSDAIDDSDIVESTPSPEIPLTVRRSTPPPAPPARKSTVPPPPPSSHVAPKMARMEPVVVPPPPAVPKISSAPDPTDILFDAVYELNFASSAWEAAGMCAETLARALNARTVVIHAHDLERRELKAIGASGDGDFEIMGTSESVDDDLVASAVLCNQKSVTMKFDGDLPRMAPMRLHSVGAPRSVVAVPAMAWGRCLAIIEVIDADERYDGRVADSAAYVAERLAEFLAEHANAA
jgi:hypothetical protein